MADKRRQKPDLTEAELDALAQITPEDLEGAKRAFRQDASPKFRDLLDATPDDGTTPPPVPT